jgi:hypothetical protein
MKTKFKVGRAYKIKFLDHTHGSKKTAIVETLGWCLEDTPEYVVFTAWRLDDEDKSFVDNNHEPFTVVKSCIKGKKVLSGV